MNSLIMIQQNGAEIQGGAHAMEDRHQETMAGTEGRNEALREFIYRTPALSATQKG